MQSDPVAAKGFKEIQIKKAHGLKYKLRVSQHVLKKGHSPFPLRAVLDSITAISALEGVLSPDCYSCCAAKPVKEKNN